MAVTPNDISTNATAIAALVNSITAKQIYELPNKASGVALDVYHLNQNSDKKDYHIKSEDLPSTTPGGADTQVQLNDSGVFGGVSDFTFNKATKVLGITGRINLTHNVGTNNMFVKANPAGILAGAVSNIGIGAGSSASLTDGDQNTNAGVFSGAAISTTSGGINYGYTAGRYETIGRRLFIDSIDRTDEATARISSLIYGELSATVASQMIRFNAITEINNYTQLKDVSAPANPSDGYGRLYKKTGNDGIFWKPDSAGSEVDLTAPSVGAVSHTDSFAFFNMNVSVDGYSADSVNGGGSTYASFYVPPGATNIVIKAHFFVTSTTAAGAVTFFGTWAAEGEVNTTNTDSLIFTGQAWGGKEHIVMDITDAYTGITGGDEAGCHMDETSSNGGTYYARLIAVTYDL